MEAILDTGALLAIADGAPRILPAIRPVRTIRVPAGVLGEFRCAIHLSPNRDEYESWLGQIATPDTFLAADSETARRFAILRREHHSRASALTENDYWLVALALQHGLTLVSQNRALDHVKGLQRLTW
ncbi:MAG: PIN domain-containing protein [Opitutales bacterium]